MFIAQPEKIIGRANLLSCNPVFALAHMTTKNYSALVRRKGLSAAQWHCGSCRQCSKQPINANSSSIPHVTFAFIALPSALLCFSWLCSLHRLMYNALLLHLINIYICSALPRTDDLFFRSVFIADWDGNPICTQFRWITLLPVVIFFPFWWC